VTDGTTPAAGAPHVGSGAGAACRPRMPGRSDLADTLREVAAARSATAAGLALAWLLKRDDHVIPIPGATKPEHVRENSEALSLELSEEEFAAIDRHRRRGRPGNTDRSSGTSASFRRIALTTSGRSPSPKSRRGHACNCYAHFFRLHMYGSFQLT
jgi:Aldo/keto reductase family